MTDDKFWMTLHKKGYEVLWDDEYVIVSKEEDVLALISRTKENFYYFEMENDGDLVTDKFEEICVKLAETPIKERRLKILW